MNCQQYALVLIGIWLFAVFVRFRRSTIVLVGGLIVVGLWMSVALIFHLVSLQDLGLGIPIPRLSTIIFATAWLVLMLVYSPLADWLAVRWFAKPPTLGVFRSIRQSTTKLIGGIVIAWVLGAFLEELAFRGIVLKTVAAELSRFLPIPIAAALAIFVAAAGAGIIHLYQGPRAAFIITQLSTLFGLLFVLSSDNLWTVILCHGMYDTIAFIRFASGKSRYSKYADDQRGPMISKALD
jgi:membrane protease YdiL (CAAX protease family)